MKALFFLSVVLLISMIVPPAHVAENQSARQEEVTKPLDTVKKADNTRPATIVQERLEDMLSRSDLATANVSFYAVNLATGEVVAEHNSAKSLTPASTMKLITTATALMLAGPDHRFKTSLGYNGTLAPDGTLTGNIVIVAGGDPSLGSRHFDRERTAFLDNWVNKIKELGIRNIRGSVVGDISIFKPQIPLTWIWGDIGNYYGAHAHPLSIYDNEYSASFVTEPGEEEPSSVGLIPPIPGLTFKMEVVSGGEGDAVISGEPMNNERIITGTLRENQRQFSLQGSIPNPSLLVVEMLTKKLADNGIQVTGEPVLSNDKVSCTLVDSVLSPPLVDILRVTNEKSINTFAENLLLQTAIWQGVYPEPVMAGKYVARFWQSKGVNTHGLFIDDGSGLSRSNGVSARHLCGILKAVYESPYYKDFRGALAIAAKSGTMTSIGGGTRAANNMAAKSGTMTRVKSYAGYVNNTRNEPIAFAILVNNFTSSPQAVKWAMSGVMVSLADL